MASVADTHGVTVTVNLFDNARSWASRLSRRSAGAATMPRRVVHRFDGERAYMARGGASVGDVKASWGLAEISVSSTKVTIRSRPAGLFEDVVIDRADVTMIGARPSEIGTAVTFGSTRPDVIFWPTDTRVLLEELRDRGWPFALTDRPDD